jgi:HK97 family phage major capsid protein
LDPSVTAVDNVTPASITSGATEVTSTGATGATIKADFRSMLDAANSDLTSPVWIMRRRDAIYLAGLEGADGGLLFPNAPREILGIPTLLTSAVPATAGSPAEDRFVVLLDQESVLIADTGRLNIEVSTRATMEMRNDPQANSKTGNATAVVSLFQTSSYAVKVVREIGWLRAHDAGVVFMQVSW